jgi:hypothetical protein
VQPSVADSPTPTAAITASPTAPEVVNSELFAARAPTPTPLPEPEPFAMNLYTDGDFVPQHTFEWCVAASIQMTYNMARDPNRSSAEDQGTIWDEARERSNDQWGGASGGGWAKLLTEWGVGEYVLAATRDFDNALRKAARAIRQHELAVGLIMWRGRHAWVMSGFESIGDPAVRPDAEVTRVRVLDPLHPHGSSVWGPSPAPDSLIGLDVLARQFVAREYRPSYDLGVPTGWLLVLPVAAAP